MTKVYTGTGHVPRGRGRKLPPKHITAARHVLSNHRHGAMLRALPVATQSSYDAYADAGGSCVPPIGDQGPCGDCHEWSGLKVCSAAQMVAGVAKPGSSFMLSVQYLLDYHSELGGCDGGDEYADAQVVLGTGVPSVLQYPGAGQGPGQQQPVGSDTMYTVAQLVYCDPTQTDQGVASTQSIKNCILAYKYVSVAGAASTWDNVGPSDTITGNDTGVDHAIGLTGWDDNHDNGDGTKGAWLLDNQWGTSWGNGGRAWIAYGADSIGTEAFVALVTAPTPTPPAPPAPPGPGPSPQPGGGFTGDITYSYVNGVVANIVAGGPVSPTLAADLKAAGVSPAVIADVLKLVSDLRSHAPFSTILADIVQVGADFGK